MKRMFRLLWLAALGVLAACAEFHGTPYQPLTDGGYGYQDQALGDGRYLIQVRGNASTSPQTLLDQLLYRASTLALAHGRAGFTLGLDERRGVELRPAYLMPVALGVVAEQRIYSARELTLNVDPPVAKPQKIPPLTQPSPPFIAQATVQFEDVDRGDGRRLFSAQAVRKRLHGRIGLPQNRSQ